MNAAPPGAMRVDARGMRCPWPALRLARAVRDGGGGGGGGGHFVVLADDPNAATEIGALAAAQGWTLTEDDGRFDVWTGGASTSPLPTSR